MQKADIKREIELSHARCRILGIKEEQVFSTKIVSGEELQKKFAENSKLIITAEPYMEQLTKFVEFCSVKNLFDF
jgi:transcriptional regulator of acetoin/glycerol metabolism